MRRWEGEKVGRGEGVKGGRGEGEKVRRLEGVKGWLVYSQDGYDGNRWFADRLLASAADEGMELALHVVPDDGSMPTGPLPDLVVMRTIRPGLSAMLEAKGVRVINNAETARVANDKWETFLLARELGLPVLDTVRFTPQECGSVRFPCVIKSLDGHGGSEVFFVRDASELSADVAATGKLAFIAQPLCDEPGVDMRVYMLGGEAIAAMRRMSRTDFRSNFSLGGEAVTEHPGSDVLEIAKSLHGRLRFDFAGIDFIRNGGRWVLNEIEDVVGTRMLYATADLDPASLFMRYISRRTW